MAAPEQDPDDHAAAAAERAMAGPVTADPHLRLTTLRAPAPGDSMRAAEILAAMRRGLARYRDVRVAQEDGFRQYIRQLVRRSNTTRSWGGHSSRGADSIHRALHRSSTSARRTAAWN